MVNLILVVTLERKIKDSTSIHIETYQNNALSKNYALLLESVVRLSSELRVTTLAFQDLVAIIHAANSWMVSSRAHSFLKWGSQIIIHP